MIGHTLVFVCATSVLVAGSTFEIKSPQQFSSQVVSAPIESSSCFSSGKFLSPEVFAPPSFISSMPSSTVSNNVFSSGCSGSSSPVVSNNVFTTAPSFSTPLISKAPTFSLPLISDSSFLPASCGSSNGQVLNGPQDLPLPMIQVPGVTIPGAESPVIALPSPPVPTPRILGQKCICTKTIVKPQVYQRTIIVPRLQRYIKRTYTPVIENISYKSTPIAQPESSSGKPAQVSFAPQSGFLSSPIVVPSGGSNSQAEFISSSPLVMSSGGSDSQTGFISTAPMVIPSSTGSSPVFLSSGSGSGSGSSQQEFMASCTPVEVSCGSSNSQPKFVSLPSSSSSASFPNCFKF